MNYKYIFLLGRPGCGKSSFYRDLEKRILDADANVSVGRIDDFYKLWAIFEHDNLLESEGKERIYTKYICEHDFRVIDDELWNLVLEQLDEDAIAIDKPNQLTFIEFARNNYIEAMQHFSDQVLQNCLIVYLYVSFETGFRRNDARYTGAATADTDDHRICREEMERIYLRDDRYAMEQYMQRQDIPVLMVDNEKEGEEHFRQNVQTIYKSIMQ